MEENSNKAGDALLPVEALRRHAMEWGEERALLVEKALAFLQSRRWCKEVVRGRLDMDLGKTLGVFLFAVEPESKKEPDTVWVMAGDLPASCLPVEGNPNAACALRSYTERLQEWVDNVFLSVPPDDPVEVNVPPTAEQAMLIKSRIRIIRKVLREQYRGAFTRCPRRSVRRFRPQIGPVRKRVLARLKRRSVETNPFTREISILVLRSPQEVAKKIIIRYMLWSLVRPRRDAIPLKEWFSRQDIQDALDVKEKDLLTRGPENLTPQERMDLAWNPEYVRALLWAGGLLKSLDFPTSRRAPGRILSFLPPKVPIESFVESFRLRRPDEILYQTDLHYCLAWTVFNTGESLEELLGRKADPDVVLERNKALQWLTMGST